MKLIFEGLSIGKNFQFYCYTRFKNSFIVRCLLVNIIYILNILVHHRYSVGKWIFNQKWCNFFWNLGQYLHSKIIFVNAKKLISSYKISIFTFMKIVLEQRYLEMLAPLELSTAEWSDDFMKIMPNPSRRTSNPIEFWLSDKSPLMLWLACDISFPPWNFFYLMIKAAKSTIALIW